MAMAVKESYAGKINRKLNKKLHVIDVAAGRVPADLVLKNATYVNVFSNELCRGDIAVAEGLIVGMGQYRGRVEADVSGKIVLPGFIDAHIHLESSLVSPKEFAKAVLPHGTTTVITDPHEIANVMGTDGIDYMFQATEGLPIDVRFMLPSCVPATPMDESGANLDYRAIDSFYDYPRVQGLAEMMNSYGVIHNDPEVVSKIVASQAHHKKIDGHAPGLQGKDLDTYVAAGVYSDHECATMEDALAKLQRGQFIMIREGTAARNLEALAPLLTPQYAERCMFCTDDKHPNDLLEKGHIDYIVKKVLSEEELHYEKMMCTLYETIGYKCIELSAATGEGVELLRPLIKDKKSLLSGNSGVGKSTLINQLIPDAEQRTAEISEAHNSGMHTTTFSEMLELPEGGYLIDTPGIKGFGTFDIEKEELTSYFKEIFKFSQDCKFSDCTHTHEPGCAVIKAVEEHYIAASRYQSYLSMLEDKDENKYREAF